MSAPNLYEAYLDCGMLGEQDATVKAIVCFPMKGDPNGEITAEILEVKLILNGSSVDVVNYLDKGTLEDLEQTVIESALDDQETAQEDEADYRNDTRLSR